MELKTKRLQIRPFLKSDLYDTYEYCSQEDVGVNAGWPAHQSLEETAAALSAWISAGHKHAIVWRENGKVIGHISVDPDSEEGRADTRELGCALNRRYHRNGIMTETIKAVLAYLFNGQDIQFVWACCFQSNTASRGMIEKCGFCFMQEGVYDAPLLNKKIPSFEYRLTRRQWQKNGG